MKTSKSAATALLAAFLSGCAGTTRIETAGTLGARAEAGVPDWSRAEARTVALDEYAYRPAGLVFRQGQAYRLRVENVGSKAHTFTAPGFFQAITVESVTGPEGRIARPVLEDIEVAAGQAVEIEFVATNPGSYALTCEEPLHEILGMAGSIRVE